MSIPAIIIIVLMSIGLLLSANLHGEPGNINFWHRLIGVGIYIGLLTWGGFFS